VRRLLNQRDTGADGLIGLRMGGALRENGHTTMPLKLPPVAKHSPAWLDRRQALCVLAASLASGSMSVHAAGPVPDLIKRRIPSTGETLPAMGLGSWITFNVGNDAQERVARAEVMRQFFAEGGRLIDSSPMYGSSQGVIGEGLQRLGAHQQVFSADKVWTSSRGARQIAESRALWGVARFDLLQVHNLLAWEENLPLLFEMKRAGQLRYVGITTSEGRRHGEFERIMQNHPLDFVQVSYNILDREVEERILPLAQARGIAVLVNRPFRQGALVQALSRRPLPGWAAELDCRSWAQVLLKFAISHPAVSCAIPATSRVDHLRENMAAGRGLLPDEALRRRMVAHVERL
jgi:diketogulonate reductase-like aldo/keto reductase